MARGSDFFFQKNPSLKFFFFFRGIEGNSDDPMDALITHIHQT